MLLTSRNVLARRVLSDYGVEALESKKNGLVFWVVVSRAVAFVVLRVLGRRSARTRSENDWKEW